MRMHATCLHYSCEGSPHACCAALQEARSTAPMHAEEAKHLGSKHGPIVLTATNKKGDLPWQGEYTGLLAALNPLGETEKKALKVNHLTLPARIFIS